MGAIRDAFNTWLRAYQIEGNPGSGINPPAKDEGRATGGVIEDAIGPPDQTITLVGASQALALEHQNAWLEIDHTDGITFIIPPNSDVAFPLPFNVFGAQAGAGQIAFQGGSGVTVLYSETLTPVTACAGSVFELRQIDTDVWRVFGQLEEA